MKLFLVPPGRFVKSDPEQATCEIRLVVGHLKSMRQRWLEISISLLDWQVS